MDRPVVAVVLAGGTGTRLYPAATEAQPKQFLALDDDRSLLARALDRAAFADETYVLTRPAYADAIRKRAPEAAVLTEPESKDTGPAHVYAAHRIRDQVGECVLLALPSDHRVGSGFGETAHTAARVAVETGGLVTIGVEPTRPATEYGYISPGTAHDGYADVEAFVEKPDAETAGSYCEQGFRWNSGVFAWTPAALLDAAERSRLAPLVDALRAGNPTDGFAAVEDCSVDRAILETASERYVVPADFAWDDLGSWDAMGRVLPTDDDGNATVGDALAIDANGCVLATDGQVSAVGIEDLVVASFGDRTLVVPRSETQRVREVVARRRDGE